MAKSDPIRSVELQAGTIPSFHIRQLRLRAYPSAAEPPEQPHRHNFHELIWIRSGTGEQDIDGQIEEITPQTLYVIARGQIHQFLRAENIEGMVIRFTDDFIPATGQDLEADVLRQWFTNTRPLTKLRIAPSDSEEFAHWFDLMTREATNGAAAGRQAILGHLLQIVMIKLERRLRLQSSNKRRPAKNNAVLFQEFLVDLEENYHLSHEVSQYAARLGVTPRQLSQITRRHVGLTAKQIINDRLTLEAKRYLQFTGYSVKEITFMLGFEDPSYFTKVFKRLAGTAPHNFRRRRRG